jgi:hypothetical protein
MIKIDNNRMTITTTAYMRVWVCVCLLCSSDSSLVCMRFFFYFFRVLDERIDCCCMHIHYRCKKKSRNRTKHQSERNIIKKRRARINANEKNEKTDLFCMLNMSLLLVVDGLLVIYLQLNQGVMSFYCWMSICVRCFCLYEDDIRFYLCFFLSVGFFLWLLYCSITHRHKYLHSVLFSFVISNKHVFVIFLFHILFGT